MQVALLGLGPAVRLGSHCCHLCCSSSRTWNSRQHLYLTIFFQLKILSTLPKMIANLYTGIKNTFENKNSKRCFRRLTSVKV
jgi:hypothetical protein